MISVTDFGAKCDGVANDDAAINAALAAAANHRTLYVPCTSKVKNVKLPVSTNVSVRITFAPGARWICENSDGSDCVSAVSSAAGNPTYWIEGLTLTGPDRVGVPTAPCATNKSGNGLNISGKATAKVFLEGVTVAQFCGSGKSGVIFGNVEDASIRDTEIKFCDRDLSFVVTGQGGGVSAVSIDNTALDQSANYNFFGQLATSITFTNLVNQSGARYGFYCDGCTAVTLVGSHSENNNISNSVPQSCAEVFESTAGNSVNDVILGGTLNSPRAAWCFLNANSRFLNARNLVEGLIANSSAGVYMDPRSTRQAFLNVNATISGATDETKIIDQESAPGATPPLRITGPPPCQGGQHYQSLTASLAAGVITLTGVCN